MANIARLLKDEITRLARKELRSQVEGLRQASAQYRRDIAALKRQVAALERRVAALQDTVLRAQPARAESPGATRARFSAKGLRAQRQRLGLSAADFGRLVGVSAQSVYNWEQEATRPRQGQLAAIAALRGIGKREARARLERLGAEEGAAS